MPVIRATLSADIAAPAHVAYGLLADYRAGHPRVLPPRVFGALVVERGGVGAGTRFAVPMAAFGSTRLLRADVTEPEPGRLLVERELGSDLVTTFSVEPAASGAGCRVTIATVYSRGSLRGWVERLLVPSWLRKVYRAELALLDAEARREAGEQQARRLPGPAPRG